MSFFVLFVGLVKAFDQVIREVVFGIPSGVTDVKKHLRDLGLTETKLNCVTSFITRHGSLFKVMGVHPRDVQLVCNQGRVRVAGICHHREEDRDVSW